jgi:hypothetical protein
MLDIGAVSKEIGEQELANVKFANYGCQADTLVRKGLSVLMSVNGVTN